MVDLKQFCSQLSKDLGLDEDLLQEEAPGIFSLPIEEEVSIKLGTLAEGFSLQCILCDCPKENPEAFLAEIMDANLFGQTTRNCVLGLTEDGNRLTLSRMIDYNLDYKSFNEFLQDFYNVALFWREQALHHLK
ncbi:MULTISPECIES: type III secretion system chaperone [unclassified Neochlamydia]|uniref:type III secretion system chaperone n=1 Tax=unclassified Neochlamydia TaxID=2643326 RepID=UPI001409C77B|nr:MULTISPECIES: type III secretion system chaperone [unclassified Neochlamydia]MBS4166568.1 Uncharacterized protein [Neochlamydia sp. AcF65]NGY95400.1 hypothetical protein [Neochlamydia sp. AcF84]